MSVETGTDSNYGLADTRYAVYFAPRPSSELKHFADAWLGRDPDRDLRVPQPVVEGITPERLHEITALPRHYGFHATLKAPFTPAPGSRGGRPAGRRRGLRRRAPAASASPAGRRAGGLRRPGPCRANDGVDQLAADCVRTFDRHRAPLSPQDRDRRDFSTAQRRRAGPSRALGLSVRPRPVPVPHDAHRPAGRAGARQDQGHPAVGPGLAPRCSRCRSTSSCCSRRPIAWLRSGSWRVSRSAHELGPGASGHPGVGCLHRPDRRHDDHDGHDHRHQPAGDTGHRRRSGRVPHHLAADGHHLLRRLRHRPAGVGPALRPHRAQARRADRHRDLRRHHGGLRAGAGHDHPPAAARRAGLRRRCRLGARPCHHPRPVRRAANGQDAVSGAGRLHHRPDRGADHRGDDPELRLLALDLRLPGHLRRRDAGPGSALPRGEPEEPQSGRAWAGAARCAALAPCSATHAAGLGRSWSSWASAPSRST